MANKQITNYTVQIEAGEQTGKIRARIVLADDKKNTQGVLVFLEGGPVPPSVTSGTIFAYFPIARYAEIIDLLRNERPVYLGANTSTGSVTIGTAAESVGEGEGTPAITRLPL